MTDAVAEQVLYGSYTQTQAMSLALAQAAADGRRPRAADPPPRAGRRAEPRDRVPARQTRRSTSARPRTRGSSRPSWRVVMAYQKIHLYRQLLESDLPEDAVPRPTTSSATSRAPLPERYGEQMREHRLRREIIATVVANQLVDRAGTTFAFRLREETGAPARRPGPRLRGGARGARHALATGTPSRRLDNQVVGRRPSSRC